MSNQEELDLVMTAIKSGLGGCVEWEPKAADKVEVELARHNLTLADVRKALIQHVRNDGEVKQIKEVREPWKDRRDYWYKVIVPMPDVFSNGLFVELELYNSDAEYPEVYMVNAHEQL